MNKHEKHEKVATGSDQAEQTAGEPLAGAQKSPLSEDSPAEEGALTETEARAFGDSDGHRYVREYLDPEDAGDSMWIAESIDNGEITACPRCRFLHLPARPFALMGYLGNDDNGQPETVQETACDVCAILPAYTRRAFGGFQREQKDLDKARENLRDSRTMRARALYDLWIGACSAADWLCWATMADSLDALRERVTGTEA